METFTCPSCKQEKPIERAQKRVREGHRNGNNRCLDCDASVQRTNRVLKGDIINTQRRENYPRHRVKQKDTMLKKKYGIGVLEWEEMFKAQGMSCAICKKNTTNGRGWQTDHNHKTGEVRAILCHGCNSLLGHAKESPEILLGAFHYLCIHGGGAENFLQQHFNSN